MSLFKLPYLLIQKSDPDHEYFCLIRIRNSRYFFTRHTNTKMYIYCMYSKEKIYILSNKYALVSLIALIGLFHSQHISIFLCEC